MNLKKLCHLTDHEMKEILGWISAHHYSLNSGYFELSFSFSPYGDERRISYFHRGVEHSLELNNDVFVDDHSRTIDQIQIDTYRLNLTPSDEALEKYCRVSRAITEAHVDEGCEPPEAGLTFEIHPDHCNLLSNRRQILDVL